MLLTRSSLLLLRPAAADAARRFAGAQRRPLVHVVAFRREGGDRAADDKNKDHDVRANADAANIKKHPAPASPAAANPAARAASASAASHPMRVRSMLDEVSQEFDRLARAFFDEPFGLGPLLAPPPVMPMMAPLTPPRRLLFEGLGPAALGAPADAVSRMMRLLTDVKEDPEGYTIVADVPGM